MESLTKNRIESIDIVRGIAMVLMALDHVRDFFHIGANMDDPMNLETTHALLYFTRWITHFCAPIFIFLSGTSIYLQSLRKTKKELGIFLIKRGLVLIAFEWTLIAFGWTFNPHYNLIALQVIWAIGISMVVMGLLMLARLPYIGFFILGAVIVGLHNLLDIPESVPGFKADFFWDLLHHGGFTLYAFAPHHYAMLVYPFPAWTGVMMLGYCCGILFTSSYTPQRRRKILTGIGSGLIVFLIILRFTNIYGDPVDWTIQKNGFFTFLSFLKLNKYPPSLLYLCMTIGPALILLAWVEGIKNRLTNILVIYGRTAFFYYILHLYFIHLIATICFFARGHSFAEGTGTGEQFPFLFVAPGEGYGLPVVYLVWAIVVIGLYPLCKWYDTYKTGHREKWWLSYL
jgi:uncharacterized membrane protein